MGPVVKLASDLKTEAESVFRNVVILQFCNLDDGLTLQEEFYTFCAPRSETFELQLLGCLANAVRITANQYNPYRT